MFFRSLSWLPIPLFLLTALLLIPQTGDLSGQEKRPHPAPYQQLPEKLSGQTYRVRVDLVNVLCSVFNENTNSFVTSLMQDDFIVYEDGEEQKIENFSRETDIPLTLAMLIDTSRSVQTKLQFEQEAAINFFQSILREDDRAMLVEFDPGVTLVQDFTNDPNKLAGEIMKLKAGGMGTSLYDAIHLSCDEKLIRETGRKAIIILSDGEDESSRHTLEQATEMALRAEAMIFAISVTKGGFFGVDSGSEGDDVLKDLVKETGGRVFFPFEIDELYDNFRQIDQELRSQYSIGYTSTNSQKDGKYRKIEVKVKEGGYKLNFRKGYYAPTS
ncbi:MAG: VWA domain-containing protein [Acidobacteria bacterium]|nr:VWA domain-containing protein [Acidobacteriota bacterium]